VSGTAEDAAEPALAERLRRGEARALARAISVVERGGEPSARILAALSEHLGGARVVGFTGPPGAGKSTLVGAYVAELRRRGQRVGVVAVDPSSPYSGGAILGDRVRMAEHTADPEVFVRSLASRGASGGLSTAVARVVDLMDAAGFDWVVVETVGAGQSDLEVAEIADTCVVLCVPGLGDEVQAIKAGILEIADLLVVNKSDLPGAVTVVQQLRAMLALRAREPAPVLTTNALTGEGVTALAEAVASHAAGVSLAARRQRGLAGARRAITRAAVELLRGCAGADPELARLAEAVCRGELAHGDAARRWLQGLEKAPGDLWRTHTRSRQRT